MVLELKFLAPRNNFFVETSELSRQHPLEWFRGRTQRTGDGTSYGLLGGRAATHGMLKIAALEVKLHCATRSTLWILLLPRLLLRRLAPTDAR
jgi:hypothetical protein